MRRSPDPETEDNIVVARSFIGSTPFKAILAGAALVLGTLLVFGWSYYLDGRISGHPLVQLHSYQIASIEETLVTMHDTHLDLKQAEAVQLARIEELVKQHEEEEKIQRDIFEAIKSVSSEVHVLDVHISKVDQSVQDLKDQTKR